MRFKDEITDGANAGLTIAQDMLKPVKASNPDTSIADIWTTAGAKAIEWMGGPKIISLGGRTDAADGSSCPPNGRLPDASQGAEHLREVFYRMGFNDRDIVALSGAHTVGRCHLSRSGFDGPWTNNPLRFDNEYFRNLINLEWQPSDRTGEGGNFQYEDVATKKLMMLPTDIALKTDPAFRVIAEEYAVNQDLFFSDFTSAYQRLLTNGTPNQNLATATEQQKQKTVSKEFREQAMHGSKAKVAELAPLADVHEAEENTGRTALHKAAFWGHAHLMEILLKQCMIDPNAKDSKGDTCLHDAARFGHIDVVQELVKGGADMSVTNNDGKTAAQVAKDFGKDTIVAHLSSL